MTRQIEILKELVKPKNYERSYIAVNNKLLLFEAEDGLMVPPDLAEYFILQDNAAEKLDKDLIEFYTLDQFKSIEKELAHWGGIPDYRNIVNTLPQYQNCFVFADYMSHLFAYAIRLYHGTAGINEVYMICGDKYKMVADSFSGFLDLYFDDSEYLIYI